MTNGELFIKENPNVEIKINGSCVWIYYDGVNHHTMPTEWWEQEIGLLEDIKAEIENIEINGHIRDVECFSAGINTTLNIINKYIRGEKNGRIDKQTLWNKAGTSNHITRADANIRPPKDNSGIQALNEGYL